MHRHCLKPVLTGLSVVLLAGCESDASVFNTAAPTAAATPAPAAPPRAAVATAASAPTPLDGLWEQASVNCAGGRVPIEPVRELDFGDDRFFAVTFVPFETYKDYWGTAEFDLEKGEIAFEPSGGNFTPEGLKLEGDVALAPDGTLHMTGMWFGDRTPGAPPPANGCDYVFKRHGT